MVLTEAQHVPMVLTEAQRALMEQNRAAALARQAAKQQRERDEYKESLAEALVWDTGEVNSEHFSS